MKRSFARNATHGSYACACAYAYAWDVICVEHHGRTFDFARLRVNPQNIVLVPHVGVNFAVDVLQLVELGNGPPIFVLHLLYASKRVRTATATATATAIRITKNRQTQTQTQPTDKQTNKRGEV